MELYSCWSLLSINVKYFSEVLIERGVLSVIFKHFNEVLIVRGILSVIFKHFHVTSIEI